MSEEAKVTVLPGCLGRRVYRFKESRRPVERPLELKRIIGGMGAIATEQGYGRTAVVGCTIDNCVVRGVFTLAQDEQSMTVAMYEKSMCQQPEPEPEEIA